MTKEKLIVVTPKILRMNNLQRGDNNDIKFQTWIIFGCKETIELVLMNCPIGQDEFKKHQEEF